MRVSRNIDFSQLCSDRAITKAVAAEVTRYLLIRGPRGRDKRGARRMKRQRTSLVLSQDVKVNFY